MARDERMEQLRHVPMFAACSDAQLKFIATRVDETDIAQGETLMTEGTTGGEMFIVLKGEAEVRQGGRTINTMRSGDHFGEIALLDRGPRSATVVAKTQMKCLVLSRSQFQDVIHQDAEIAITLLYSVMRRLRDATPQRSKVTA